MTRFMLAVSACLLSTAIAHAADDNAVVHQDRFGKFVRVNLRFLHELPAHSPYRAPVPLRIAFTGLLMPRG